MPNVYRLQTLSTQINSLIDKHLPIIKRAVEATRNREFFAHWPESTKPYGEEAEQLGKAQFENQIGKPFNRLQQIADHSVVGSETSPYTASALAIQYPVSRSTSDYISRATNALQSWKKLPVEARASLLLESLDRMANSFFEIAFATMHGTGQAYMMSFQASGPHAADRALEAIAVGYDSITRYADSVHWVKPMGKFDAVVDKQYVAIPKGIALSIGCSTFPVWNSLPGIYASLITGNTVIHKPHPMGVYSIAIQIANLQEVFKEYGLDPHIIQLATDTIESPITKELAENPAIKIIDYTGSSSFGNYIESLPGKVTFTEKAGVNTVILDSVTDLGKVAQNLAFSFSLYSGQMCTAPQNVFIPKEGIKGPEGVISYDEVVNALTTAIKGLSGHPKAGPGICGAIQNPATLERIDKAKSMGSRVLLESAAIANPDFPNARTASPLVIEVPANKPEVFEQELFGPIVLIIPTDSTDQSIALAQSMAQQHGAISCAAYTTNADTQEKIAEAMADAYTPTAFNLMGQVFVNQNAAFSDPHVSGGNPAGNASFTNDEFVAKRYTVVEFKVEPTQA